MYEVITCKILLRWNWVYAFAQDQKRTKTLKSNGLFSRAAMSEHKMVLVLLRVTAFNPTHCICEAVLGNAEDLVLQTRFHLSLSDSLDIDPTHGIESLHLNLHHQC